MTQLSSWGRISADDHHIIDIFDTEKIITQLKDSLPGIAHGMGRSYGDVCLNSKGNIWRTIHLDHFIYFDRENGILTCESGVLLNVIQNLVMPCGWMLPVTPGTQMITVGGAIANDVHGKNHHFLGTFGHHIRTVKILRTTGEVITCGPNLLPEWFAATIGGMGLTGVILEASIQLRAIQGPWLENETIPFNNIDDFFSLSESSENSWEYTVAWIDCISSSGRGIFMRANHSHEKNKSFQKKHKIRIPITPPFSLVNKLTLKPFNAAYFYLKKLKAGSELIHYEPFFYPLDNVLEWNRLYGINGFYQYQCVIPFPQGPDVIKDILQIISKSRIGSFLAVLKSFGKKPSSGMLSFPMHGITLALDFPNQNERTHALFKKLNAIVRDSNGRIYCAKDATMPREIFERGYPKFREFAQYRDPGISSSLSLRLLGV